MILPPNYLSPPSSPCNSARDPPGLSTGIQTGIRRVDCDVPFDCHIFQNQFPGFTRTRQITTESSSYVVVHDVSDNDLRSKRCLTPILTD